MKCVRVASAVVLILLAGATAWAQGGTDARDAIERKSRGGDRLTIDMRQGPTLEGRLVRTNADALVLDLGGREQAVAFGDIDRVRRRRNGVAAGAVIGLAAGLTFGIPARMLVNDEHGNGNAALATLVVTGVGAGVLFDSVLSLNRTIFRRSAASVHVAVEPQLLGAAVRVVGRW